MSATSLATQTAEPLTDDSQAPALRVVSARGEFEEMRRRQRHDSISRKMSQCGKRLAPAPSSPALVGKPLDEMTEIYVIFGLGIGFGLVFSGVAERVIDSIASAISPPQVQSAAARAPDVAMGAATIAFDKVSGKIWASVEINGVPARLELDTGCNEILLTAEIAKRAHLVGEGAAYETMGIGGGRVKEKAARVALLSVGGISIKDARVWVEESPDPSLQSQKLDGLLGLSFMRKFQVRMANGVFELTPLKP
jgi:predicted aspartyl protease